MKKKDVRIGETYTVKVSGQLVPVQLTGDCAFGGWFGINRKTGKQVRIKTAARLRGIYIPRQQSKIATELYPCGTGLAVAEMACKSAAKEWYRLQVRNIYAHLYAYVRPARGEQCGYVYVAEDPLDENDQLLDPTRLAPNWALDQVVGQLCEWIRHAPVLGE